MCIPSIERKKVKEPQKGSAGPSKHQFNSKQVRWHYGYGKLDIFLISETKIDSSFPDAQFSNEGYFNPYRKDRCLGSGGLLM